MTASTPTTWTSGPHNWMQLVLTAVGFALLISVLPQPAGAEEQDPAKAGQNQVAGCAIAGGDSHVEVVRTNEGLKTTTVQWKGGLLDGVTCINNSLGSFCFHVSAQKRTDDGSRLPATGTLDALESGSLNLIKAALVDLDAADLNGPIASERLSVSADDEELGQHVAKENGKRGKQVKGKHASRNRKR